MLMYSSLLRLLAVLSVEPGLWASEYARRLDKSRHSISALIRRHNLQGLVGKKPKVMMSFTCAFCDSETQRPRGLIRGRLRRNKTDKLYCSRSCWGMMRARLLMLERKSPPTFFRLAELLKEKPLSEVEAARRLGCSREWVRQLKNKYGLQALFLPKHSGMMAKKRSEVDIWDDSSPACLVPLVEEGIKG